jgi:hypothetical protein
VDVEFIGELTEGQPVILSRLVGDRLAGTL